MKKEDLKKLADLLNEYIVYECLKWENKIDYFQNEGNQLEKIRKRILEETESEDNYDEEVD